MNKKEMAVKWIQRKLRGESFLSYAEIAEYLDYHPKYFLYL